MRKSNRYPPQTGHLTADISCSHAGRPAYPGLQTFIKGYHAELNAAARAAETRRARLDRRFATVERKLAGVLKAIEGGLCTTALKNHLLALDAEKAEIVAARKSAGTPTPIRVHPNLAKVHAEKVTRIEAVLTEPASQAEAQSLIRDMIDRIVLTPAARGMDAELHGNLAAILAISEQAMVNKRRRPSAEDGRQLSVVAGARNQLSLLFRAVGIEPSQTPTPSL